MPDHPRAGQRPLVVPRFYRVFGLDEVLRFLPVRRSVSWSCPVPAPDDHVILRVDIAVDLVESCRCGDFKFAFLFGIVENWH